MATRLTAYLATAILLGGAALPAGAALTERVSVSSTGTEGNNDSYGPVISVDGRFVGFFSYATNLAPPGTAFGDAFLHDRHTGITERVSITWDGTPTNGNASVPGGISADGRFVVFGSPASNLVPDDTNGHRDTFVRDRQAGVTERVSVDSAGLEADDSTETAVAISADGRFVAFASRATNLVAGDTGGGADVFVRDRLAGTTELVSSGSATVDSFDPSLSADGRFVAFWSYAPNLVPGDTNNNADVFVRDRLAATTERVSVDSAGAQVMAPGEASHEPFISADGRFVAFSSGQSQLVPGDTNGRTDGFVHDRVTGATTRVTVDSAGTEANAGCLLTGLSADGRFVGFTSQATNLVPGDTNGFDDVFLHDRLSGITERVSLATSGAQANNPGNTDAALSGDGRIVAFISRASNLGLGDENSRSDVFTRDRNCGNGLVDPGEQCDDGGNLDGDCCMKDCRAETSGVACTDDANSCTTDRCDGAGNCIHDCSDADICTEDTCTPPGCLHVPIPQCDPAGSTEARVGGPGRLCTGGTLGPDGCTLQTPNASLTIPLAGPPFAVPESINIAVVATTVDSNDDCPEFFALQGTTGRLVTCTEFLPRDQAFDVPVTLGIHWQNELSNACFVQWHGSGTLREGNLQILRNGVPLSDRCGTGDATPGCPSGPLSQACYDPGLCDAAVCDPGANTWTVQQIRHFSEYAVSLRCASTGPSRLSVSALDTPPGDDRLSFRGGLTLTGADLVTIDPLHNGCGVVLNDATGTVLDVTIPGVPFSPATGMGWRVNSTSTRWLYVNQTPSPPGGITKIKLNALPDGTVGFAVRGKRGAYGVGAAVGAQLVLPGDCFAATYPGPAGAGCRPSAGGKKLVCR